ncbi:hypothetical protein BH09ACT4_BH09ACT4_16620 [soil metagenome]
MRRHLWWGLVGVAIVALSVPLAGGALAFAAPAAPAVQSIAPVASVEPPPPSSKTSPITQATTVAAPTSIPGRVTGGFDRRTSFSPTSSGCGGTITGTTGSAPSAISPKGVHGTTTLDLSSFALAYNQKRVAQCLKPVPMGNFHYDSCMETRLFWMAEDPSTNPASAWGHIGTKRSDGVPSVGCDGNLAGGMNNSGSTVALKWWDSSPHRTALYKPTYSGSTANVCIYFAMTHGGVPNEPTAFTRAAARWATC